MANAAALINEGLWRKDKDFQALPRLAQCTFLQVLSQKDLDCAGVLTLHLELLAKGCNELTVEDLRTDFKALEAARFVFVDYDTDELFLRSYVRLVSVRSPNAWKSAFKAARLIVSVKIRRELAAELRRMNRRDADALADEIDPNGTPSGPHPEGIRNPSEGGIPSERDSEPPRSVLVVGQVTSRSSQVGEGQKPPRPECPKHGENFDGPCRACKRRREWDEQHAAQAEADELDAKRRQRLSRLDAIAACPLCDENGNRELDDETVARCEHPEARHA